MQCIVQTVREGWPPINLYSDERKEINPCSRCGSPAQSALAAIHQVEVATVTYWTELYTENSVRFMFMSRAGSCSSIATAAAREPGCQLFPPGLPVSSSVL
jgi:hypothetical protein